MNNNSRVCTRKVIAVMGRSTRGFEDHLKAGPKKALRFGTGNYVRISTLHFFTALFIIGSLLCFFIIVGCSYTYISPFSETLIVNNLVRANRNSHNIRATDSLSNGCNMFDGRWVKDERNPLYNASQCPFLEPGFDCLANGRKDEEYLKWRWKPRDCQVPRFDVLAVLEFLRGKRVVFVGDSLGRTQWESMVCMLMSGVKDKNSVYEVNGNAITKQIRHLVVRFSGFNLSLEFYRLVFLVRPGVSPKLSPKRVKKVVKLDRMDGISREWIDSDILVFNSGHWWTPTKLFDMGRYFEFAGKIKLGMTIDDAFKIALSTWQLWIEKAVNPNRTRIFFRTFESTHWRCVTISARDPVRTVK
ncbi:protein trichome berefringence-like 7 isoform X2 [Andrographis paniculata]|uniref:protein trichome berefringence-like 7 isoform X2 n=1 Tax=Andrographis paniculata TaxID=175694 RepID=UPI0021E73DF6|nr:protein trichome berefringence-like 7 isoform X2 [Andrographis paniculata]